MVDYVEPEESPVDWSSIPTLNELEDFLGVTYKSHPYYGPLLNIPYYPEYPITAYYPLKLEKDDYLVHDTNQVDDVIDLYEENGFETQFILQDPFGHPGPTVACPIGFPFNLPKDYHQSLKRFSRWICRVHVDVCYLPQSGILVSVPHIEPDPVFHKLAHLWDTYILKHVVRGKPSVNILKWLLGI